MIDPADMLLALLRAAITFEFIQDVDLLEYSLLGNPPVH